MVERPAMRAKTLTANVEYVKQVLSPFLAISALFATTLKCLSHTDDKALVAVGGSIAKGSIDRYSDLDFVVGCSSHHHLEQIELNLLQAYSAVGILLTNYRATHLSMENLHVYLLYDKASAWIVKIDVKLLLVDNINDVTGMILLRLPPGRDQLPTDLLVAPPRLLTQQELGALCKKFVGWTWYTYSKAARGELMEAAASLDFTRRHALLPLIAQTEHIVLEDYRRIEDRLPKDVVQRLNASYPKNLTSQDIIKGLSIICGYYSELHAQVKPHSLDCESAQTLDLIFSIIKHDMANVGLKD